MVTRLAEAFFFATLSAAFWICVLMLLGLWLIKRELKTDWKTAWKELFRG